MFVNRMMNDPDFAARIHARQAAQAETLGGCPLGAKRDVVSQSEADAYLAADADAAPPPISAEEDAAWRAVRGREGEASAAAAAAAAAPRRRRRVLPAGDGGARRVRGALRGRLRRAPVRDPSYDGGTMEVAVLGSMGSGTVATSRRLRALGLDVTHETTAGADGVVSWLHALLYLPPLAGNATDPLCAGPLRNAWHPQLVFAETRRACGEERAATVMALYVGYSLLTEPVAFCDYFGLADAATASPIVFDVVGALVVAYGVGSVAVAKTGCYKTMFMFTGACAAAAGAVA
ncbi:hypothetical protein JL721_9959 [Aureococcus anophagefferens]|nr:hypothetical protein JL721_9959 [Aureococcus anophagefferens]